MRRGVADKRHLTGKADPNKWKTTLRVAYRKLSRSSDGRDGSVADFNAAAQR